MRLRLPPLLSAAAPVAAALAVPAAPVFADPPAAPAARVAAGPRVEKDLKYVEGGDPAQVLDLYLPRDAADGKSLPNDKPLPLVVWVHGGGWQAGNKNGCPLTYLATHGYAVASVEYRFSQKALFPAQIQDCQAAIRWLRANAGKYRLDPAHVGVGGDSAGGHLSALLGTAGGAKAFSPVGGNEDQPDRVQAVCDFYGPADFATVVAQSEADAAAGGPKNIFKFNNPGDPYSALIGGPLQGDKAAAVSPVHYVSRDDPPFLILHGTADALVPFAQSVELADKLKAAGVDATLQRFPGGQHGGPAFLQPAVRDLIKTFFDKHLKGADVKVEPLPDSVVTVLAPAAAADTRAMQGAWTVVKRVKNGEATSEEEVRGTPVVLTFAGATVSQAKGGQSADDGTFTLDPAATPRRITMTAKTGDHAGQAFQGVYELSGDTLKIAYGVGDDAKAPPKDFAGGPGSGLLVLARQAKGEGQAAGAADKAAPADKAADGKDAKADAKAEKADGVVELFNGKDLTGWGYRAGGKADGKAEPFDGKTEASDQRYSAKDGAIVVNPGKGLAALWTTKEFAGDFELRLEFRASVNADSGLFVRKPQLQVRDYLVAGPYKQLKKYKPQDWNEIVVLVKGGVAHCTCNGEVLEAALKVPATGPIGLEADRGQMEYRNLRLRPLK